MKKSLLIILALYTLPVQADFLDINLGSKHTSQRSASSRPYNENNHGLGYTTSDYTVGFYHNSYYKTSVYAGLIFQQPFRYVNVGVIMGGITGYEEVSGYKVMPVVLPYVSFKLTPKVRLKVTTIPSVIGFSLQVKL